MTSSKAHAHSKKSALSLAERRERLLDEIALERIEMKTAAQQLMAPLHRVDSLREQVAGARYWLYPVAPVLALLAFRLRPRLRSLPGLAARGWTLWRLYRRFAR